MKVGVAENPPIALQHLDGKPEGLVVDVMDDIAAQNDWELEYVQLSWPVLLESLEKGEIDVLTGIAFSEERAWHFEFSKQSLVSNWGIVYRSPGIGIGSILELQGKRLALVPEATHSIALIDLLEKFGVTYTLVRAKDYGEALEFIDDASADAAVVSRLFGTLHANEHNVAQTSINFNPVEVRFAIPKGANKDVLFAIDQYLSIQKANDNSHYFDVLRHWMEAPVHTRVPVWVYWVIGGIIVFLCMTWVIVAWLRREVEVRTRELKDSEIRFRDFAKASADWLWETDEEHRFTFISDEDYFHISTVLSMDSIVGMKRTDFGIDDMARYPEKWNKHLADLDARRPIEDFEYSVAVPQGGAREISVWGSPIFNADGTFKGYRGVARDITERKQVRAQLIHSSKLATLGEMATGMAHELNQPLNIIRMTAEVLIATGGNGDTPADIQMGKLEKILDQVDRASAIIDHMRVFGRKDSDHLGKVDLREAVLGAVGLVQDRMRLTDIDLFLDLPETCRKVIGKQLQLEQVVLNLLRNAEDAIKESKHGDGDRQRVDIKITDDLKSKDVILTVRDTGGGIPNEILDRIFEPFFTTKDVGKGTGLGLSISYGIIIDMGGRFEAANIDGGVEFTITLPAVNEDAK